MRLFRRDLLLAAAAGAPFARGAAAAPAPFVLLCPLAEAPGVLVPGLSGAFATRFIGSKLYRGLMRWGPDGRLEPDLASAAGVSADGLTYLFRLRPDVLWHDSGGFSAEDVVFSLARFHAALQPALPLGRVRVEAADAHTVALHLSAAGDLSLAQLGGLSLPIVPRHVHDQPGWGLDPRRTPPVGTGPFRWDGWLRLLRYEWFAGPKPALAAINCTVVPDAAARAAAAAGPAPVLLAGRPAVLPILPQLRAAAGLVVEASFPPGGRAIAGVRFNRALPPLDQPALRRALAASTDAAAAVRQAWSGFARPATGPLVAGSAGRNEAAVLPSYDPRAAAQQLTAAGLRPDDTGVRARLHFLHPPDPPWAGLAALLARGWRQIGVELTPEPVDAAEWGRRVAAGAYDATGFVADQVGDARTDLSRYADAVPALRPLLEAGQLDAAQALLVDAMPVLWLAEPGYPVARSAGLAMPGGVFGDFADARLAPAPDPAP